jgi:putative MATE family efflux protein
LIDIYWVGKLGPAPIAAVSLVWILFSIVLAVSHTLGTGTVALVAQSYGEKEYAKADYISRESLTLTLITASILCLLGFIFSQKIIHVLGGRGEVLVSGTEYFRIISIAYLFQILTFNINFSLRGSGDMTTPMKILFIASLLNIVLDPLLIFGIGFFPRLEIRGAAYATLIAQIFAFFYAYRVFQRKRSLIQVLPRTKIGFNLNRTLTKTLLLIGLPVGLQFGMMGGVRMVVLRLTADYGTNVLAAAGIGFRILLMAVLPVVAIGIATTTLVGQNIGARKLERSQKSGFLSIVIAMGAMVFLGLLTALLAKPLMGIFTEDPEVITFGVDFLRIVSLSLFFIGAAIAANGVFRGAGDTTPPMIISFVKLLLLIALAFILPKGLEMGVRGLWWSMVLVYVIESILIGIWFFLGKWKKKRVEEIEIPHFTLPSGSKESLIEPENP